MIVGGNRLSNISTLLRDEHEFVAIISVSVDRIRWNSVSKVSTQCS